jgi:hypothetical protein
VDIQLTGVLRVDFATPNSRRLRVIFLAVPRCQSASAVPPLKSVPDHHSRGAQWVTLADCNAIEARQLWRTRAADFPRNTCHMRGEEPLEWFGYVAAGGFVAPLSCLESVRRGAPADWAGPGDPPRAHYPTTFVIKVVIADAGDSSIGGIHDGSEATGEKEASSGKGTHGDDGSGRSTMSSTAVNSGVDSVLASPRTVTTADSTTLATTLKSGKQSSIQYW